MIFKYKICDIIKYKETNIRVKIIGTNIDKNNYRAYETQQIDGTPFVTPCYPWVDANLLESQSEYDKIYIRKYKLNRIYGER